MIQIKKNTCLTFTAILLYSCFNTLSATNYFVKTIGSGNGKSWDNSSSLAAALTKASNGDTIFIAGGIYKPANTSSVFEITKGLVLIGGYDPLSIGTKAIEPIYPSAFETIFSGDVDGDGITNSGNSRVLFINNPTQNVTIKGIRVTQGYSKSNSTSVDAYRSGIDIHGLNSNIHLLYCTIDNCLVENNASNNSCGGAGISFYSSNTGTINSSLYLYRTIIKNNTNTSADNRGRGAGIRIMNGVSLIMEQCLVAGNTQTGPFGAGIQGSGQTNSIYLLNTTVTNNTASGTGAHGVGVNTSGNLYIVSSTITNNHALGTSSRGHELRSDYPQRVHIINSIIAGTPDNNSANSIYLDGSGGILTSQGFNILGAIGGVGSFSGHIADLTNQTFSDVFANNELADNGGFSQTIIPSELACGAKLSELNAFKSDFSLVRGDIGKDQRGYPRASVSNARVCRGAYDDGTVFPDTIKVVETIKRPLLEENAVVWGQGYGENSFVRFPLRWQSVIPTENNIWGRVIYSAGMQIRFKTNTSSLIVNCINTSYSSNNWFGNAGANAVDLYIKKKDGKFYPCYSASDKRTVGSKYEFDISPNDADYLTDGYEYILYMPSVATVSNLSIEISKNANFEFIPVQTNKKPIVFYGTSILNGIAASRAGNNITNIASRTFYDRNIVNLGFSGRGRMESEVIAAINEIDADIYILDCMPNMHGNYISNIKQRFIDGVDSIMKHHPNAAIILTEHPGYANMAIYKSQAVAVNSTNAELKKAYNELKNRHNRLFYFSREEIGINMATDMADYIHPNDKGMYKYAESYINLIKSILNE